MNFPFLELFFEKIAGASPVLYVAVRASAIIFPPLPGTAIDLIGLGLYGWLKGFIYSEIGVISGSMISFYLARIFREPIVARFTPVRKFNNWHNGLSGPKQFWGLVGLRLFSNPLFDYVGYLAGLSQMPAAKFFIATVIGTTPLLFAIFYFGNIVIRQGFYWTIAVIIVAVLTWLAASWQKIKKFTFFRRGNEAVEDQDLRN